MRSCPTAIRRPATAAPRLLLSLLLALAVAVAWPTAAVASCAYAEDDPRLVELADVIFTGEIVGDQPAKLGAERRVTFAVRRVYKGEAYASQLVASPATGEAFTVAGPGEVLVLARYPTATGPRPPRSLTTNGCSGSRLGPAPAALGVGSEPTPGRSTSVGAGARTVGFVGAGLAMIILAVLVNRRAAGRRA